MKLNKLFSQILPSVVFSSTPRASGLAKLTTSSMLEHCSLAKPLVEFWSVVASSATFCYTERCAILAATSVKTETVSDIRVDDWSIAIVVLQ